MTRALLSLLASFALIGCHTSPLRDVAPDDPFPVVVHRMPEGIYLDPPSTPDQVQGWPDGFVAIRYGPFGNRRGYGATVEEAIRNAGGLR